MKFFIITAAILISATTLGSSQKAFCQGSGCNVPCQDYTDCAHLEQNCLHCWAGTCGTGG